MMDIIQIRNSAYAAADEGKSEEACPFAETSVHGQLWLDYFHAQQWYLLGDQSA